MLLAAAPTGAQEVVAEPESLRPPMVEPTGLVGHVTFGGTRLVVDDAPLGTRVLGGLRLGWRSPIWKGVAPRLRVGVEGSLEVTDIGGVDSTSDPYAFGVLDAGALVSFRVLRNLRVYGNGRFGKRAIERVDSDRQVWNWAGTGWSVGGGVELPLLGSGRGLDVGVHRLQGRFTRADRLKVYRDIDARYRAWTFHVGWGGPVDIGLPWT